MPGVDRVYSVPIDGSAPPVDLSAGFLFTELSLEGLATNTNRALFRDGLFLGSLYSVPFDGSSPPVAVSSLPLIPTDGRTRPRITADGASVLFLAQGGGSFASLFRAPMDGSAAASALHDPPVPGGEVVGFELAESGTERAVFLADHLENDVHELFSVPVDGSAPELKLNTPLAAGTAIGVGPFRIAPDGSRVAYWAIQDSVVRNCRRCPSVSENAC